MKPFGPEVMALRDATLAARARTNRHIATSIHPGPLFRVEEHFSRGRGKTPRIEVLMKPASIEDVIKFIDVL